MCWPAGPFLPDAGLCILKEEGNSNMTRWGRFAFTVVVKVPSFQQTPSAQLFSHTDS